jgi:hypothetical protein
MSDQKPKAGYVVPRNGAQGAPGYAMPPQPQRAAPHPKRPQQSPTPTTVEAPIDVTAEAAVSEEAAPKFSDEELLLCRHLLYFTADGGNDAPPEVVQLAKGMLAKIETAMLARHANDPVNGEHIVESDGLAYAIKHTDLPSEEPPTEAPAQVSGTPTEPDTALHSQ